MSIEKEEIIRSYRKLLRKAKPILKEGDTKIIKKAFALSLEAHKDMRRKSGEMYISHPLAVAQICVEEIGLGTTAIVSALIHDVVEDTSVQLEEIEIKFGKKVAVITDGLTKIEGALGYNTSAQAENFHKIILSLSKDVRVILIKLADRLHNMRTLSSMPRDKQLKIASETIYFYAPLAHRLGLNTIKSELEDIYLRFTDQKVYYEIATRIDQTKVSRGKFVRQFVRPIKKELDKLPIKYIIKGRPKSIYSIWKKMCKQDIPFEEVYDLFAIRIIIDVPLSEEKSRSWQVYSTITDHYTPNPDRLRDWISVPKTNGYESLHTTVMAKNGQWVEVQIRTTRMDDIAEKGYAAHWKYKHNSPSPVSNLEKWLLHVRGLIERKDLSALEWVDDFKDSLFTKEVFVFTPAGELKTFPQGATALDFAFEIHSDIGKHCQGAKVNQKLESISYVLKNGDQVEIITSKKQKPNEGWLQFVKTSKAKAKTREALKEDKKQVAEQGKALVLKKLKRLKMSLNDKLEDRLMTHFCVHVLFDLYYKVGMGITSVNELNFLKEPREVPSTPSHKSESKKEAKKKPGHKPGEDILLIGDNMDVVDYSFVKCCTPIPGDDVFGFLTATDGIKIHRTNCPNSPQLLASYGNRIIRAKWASDHEVTFRTGLKIVGTDRFGLVNDLFIIISAELRVNMSSVSFKTENGIFTGKITLYVKNIQHLDLLMSKLQQVEGTITITRQDLSDTDKHIEKKTGE